MDRRTLLKAMVLVGAAGVTRAQAQADGAQSLDRAQKAAEDWMALVDAGQYDASWDAAATLFQKSLPKEKWAQAAAAAREPLGKLVSRKVDARQYAEKLPGAPDGQYVVITLKTSFQNKKEAVETITPMMDGARGWRVSGYFIK